MAIVSCVKNNDLQPSDDNNHEIFIDTLWDIYKYDLENDFGCIFPKTECFRVIEYKNKIFASTVSEIAVLQNNCWESTKFDGRAIFRVIDSQLYLLNTNASYGEILYKYEQGTWILPQGYNLPLCNIFQKGGLGPVLDFIEFENSVFFVSFYGETNIVEFKGGQYYIRNDIKTKCGRLEIDSKSRLWFLEGYWDMNDSYSTTEYIYYLKNNELDSVALPESVTLNTVAAIEDQDGIMIATDHKVYKLSGGVWIDITENFPSSSINDFEYDKQGRLWISTWDKGVAQLKNGEWEVFDQHTPLSENLVNPNKLFFDSMNNAWIPTWRNGLVLYKGEKINKP